MSFSLDILKTITLFVFLYVLLQNMCDHSYMTRKCGKFYLSFSEAVQTHWRCIRYHPWVTKCYVEILRCKIKYEYITLHYSAKAETLYIDNVVLIFKCTYFNRNFSFSLWLKNFKEKYFSLKKCQLLFCLIQNHTLTKWFGLEGISGDI